MDSNPPTMGDLAYNAAHEANQRNASLEQRVAELETAIGQIIEWSSEIADAINHLAEHCKCTGDDSE